MPLYIGTNEIHIWFIRLGPMNNAELDRLAILSVDEKQKSDEFKFEKDRIHFVIRRTVVRRILGKYLDADPKQLVFSCNEFGKPNIKGMYPGNSLHFNSSHTNNMLMFGVCSTNQIGVDIEQLNPFSDMDEVAQTIFTVEELKYFNQLPIKHKVDFFFKGWTAKEAVVKAIGKGLQIPMNSFYVNPTIGYNPHFVSSVQTRYDSFGFSVKTITTNPKYPASVAILQSFEEKQLLVRDCLMTEVL